MDAGHNDQALLTLFERGEFEIIRKPPEILLAMRRLVYDNDTLYNCFPSYHVTLSQLVAWATWELDREGPRVAGQFDLVVRLLRALMSGTHARWDDRASDSCRVEHRVIRVRP